MSSLGPLLPILNPFVLFNNQRINAAQTLPINFFSFVSFQTNPLTTLMVCSIKSTMTNRRVQQNYKSNIVSFRCHWIKTWNFLILLLDMFTLVTIISHPIQPFVWFAKAVWTSSTLPQTRWYQYCIIINDKIQFWVATCIWFWVRRKKFDESKKGADVKSKNRLLVHHFYSNSLWSSNMLHLYISVKWLICIRM